MKVIIWGHKLHSHSHSYIHSYYYRAFKKLDYEVFWLDHKDRVDRDFFRHALVLTEGQVDHDLTLDHSCHYVLHHCDAKKYEQANVSFLHLGNYTATNSFENCIKINKFTYFNMSQKTLFQPWGTDLLPDEIDISTSQPFNASKNQINYIGTIWEDNAPYIDKFIEQAAKNQVEFRNFCSGYIPYRHKESELSNFLRRIQNKFAVKFGTKKIIDDAFARSLITQSLIAPDIRNLHHKAVGYIPCRIFKNISYGMLPGTNSVHIFNFFDGALPYAQDEGDLYYRNIEDCSHSSYSENMKYLMEEVAKNHTYITRAKQILELITS